MTAHACCPVCGHDELLRRDEVTYRVLTPVTAMVRDPDGTVRATCEGIRREFRGPGTSFRCHGVRCARCRWEGQDHEAYV